MPAGHQSALGGGGAEADGGWGDLRQKERMRITYTFAMLHPSSKQISLDRSMERWIPPRTQELSHLTQQRLSEMARAARSRGRYRGKTGRIGRPWKGWIGPFS